MNATEYMESSDPVSSQESDKVTEKPSVTVSIELLQNLRNIIDIANARVHWKTEELLPLGLVIKQLDSHLQQPKST